LWSADLVSGVCKKCRDAETAQQLRQQEQAESARHQAAEERRRALREAAIQQGAVAYHKQQAAARDFAQLEVPMRVCFKLFKPGLTENWESLLQRAADFANALPPSSVLNISVVAEPSGKGLVTVWYWHKDTMEFRA
jgi:hypothetical protein